MLFRRRPTACSIVLFFPRFWVVPRAPHLLTTFAADASCPQKSPAAAVAPANCSDLPYLRQGPSNRASTAKSVLYCQLEITHMVDDLLALQRQIDGYSSSGEEDHEEDGSNEEECSVTSNAVGKVASGPHEKEVPGNRGSSQEDEGETKNDEQHTHENDDDDVAFDLAAVVMEGRKERKERKKKLAQEKRDRDSGVVSGVSLPCPEADSPKGDSRAAVHARAVSYDKNVRAEAEIELMKKRVREETERRMLEERRSQQQRPEELTHVSAGGDGSGGAPHLSRRERRQQKAEAANKKPQQVYVGLPIGTSWHVPLVGIEGRGGYKQPSSSSKDGGDGSGDTQTGGGGEKRKGMTIKEREKLKRQKGQSSHSTWKPELWMQLRQQYD